MEWLTAAIVGFFCGLGLTLLFGRWSYSRLHVQYRRRHQPPPPLDPLADADDWLSEQIAEADRLHRHDEAVARGDLIGAAAVEAETLPPLADEPGEMIYYRPEPGADRPTWLVPSRPRSRPRRR